MNPTKMPIEKHMNRQFTQEEMQIVNMGKYSIP